MDTADRQFNAAIYIKFLQQRQITCSALTVHHLRPFRACTTRAGLYHTFENGCASPGDEVADTPACQAPVDETCPSLQAVRDSCPNSPGKDPSSNFMSYSVDSCLKSFTPGQLQRIQKMWQLYRAAG
jgi:hypothetical protein